MAQTLQEYTAEKEAEAKDIKAQNREAKLREEIKFHKNETEKVTIQIHSQISHNIISSL